MAEKRVILSSAEEEVTLEILSERAIRDQYLLLRHQIYHQEFGYSLEGVKSPADFWDRFDPESVSLGLFIVPRRLIGAVRLVEAASTSGLPSCDGIPSLLGESAKCKVGELSRVMVAKPYRGLGIFAVLCVSVLILAQRRRLSCMFISEADCPAYHEFLGRLGFKMLQRGFFFNDGVIAPPVRSACFCMDLTQRAKGHLYDMKLRRQELFEAACSRIRTAQEQATHSSSAIT